MRSVVNGYNGAIFAYGQTAAGKTHTMQGSSSDPGILSQAVRDLYEAMEAAREDAFVVKVSYLEVYNEKVRDLLDGKGAAAGEESRDIPVRTDAKGVSPSHHDDAACPVLSLLLLLACMPPRSRVVLPPAQPRHRVFTACQCLLAVACRWWSCPPPSASSPTGRTSPRR